MIEIIYEHKRVNKDLESLSIQDKGNMCHTLANACLNLQL